MKLFEVGEDVKKGWLVRTDPTLQLAFVTLGRDKQDLELYEDFRFDTGLSVLMFAASDLLKSGLLGEGVLDELRIDNGDVARDGEELLLIRPQGKDQKALVHVGISPGVGGEVRYTFGEGVDIIAEGVLGVEAGSDAFPMYILAMEVGSFFVVERTGRDIDGPKDLGFQWDGKLLSRHVRSAKSSR